MFFGLTNALVSFQEYINKIFMETLNILIIIYLDDILNYIKDRNSHIAVVR